MKTELFGFNKNINIDQDDVLIIDWHNLMYRNLFTSYGEDPLDYEFRLWKYQMLVSLSFILKTFTPTKVVIASDGKNPWRKDYYTDYKANRSKSRSESEIDFDHFFKISEEFYSELKSVIGNVKWVELPRVEADDVIKVVSDIETKSHFTNKVTIVSADGDFKQLLINPNIKLYNPIKKEYVETLDAYMDLQIKIICGDRSDNISGIKKGVGPKTAEKLLNKGELNDLLESDISINENFIRNKRLIDMNMIPNEIVENITKEYLLPTGELDKVNIFNTLTKHAPRFMDDIAQFISRLSKLNPNEEVK